MATERKVLFIQPPNIPPTERGLLIEPIDVATDANYARKLGYEVEFLDMDARGMQPTDAAGVVQDTKPDYVVMFHDHHIPLHSNASREGVLQIARIVKERGVKGVGIGGKTATYQPDYFLFPNSPFDVTIGHEAENALKELMPLTTWSANNLIDIPGISFMKEGKIVRTHPPRQKIDVDKLQILKRKELVDYGLYAEVRTILSSRGCDLGCTFCPVTGYWGPWRGRSPANVVEEIADLANEGTHKVMFLDDNATADMRRMEEISRQIIQEGIDVRMGSLGVISSFEQRAMELMHRAGFRWIHYGAETGDGGMQKSIRKNLTPEQMVEVIQRTKSIGFRVRTSWILDLPGTTESALEKTLELIRSTQTDEIRLHYLALRMGSAIYNRTPRNGHVEYIHSPGQNVNLTLVDSERMNVLVDNLLEDLQDRGYRIIRHPSELSYQPQLKHDLNADKIVTLCPLRYGINWEAT